MDTWQNVLREGLAQAGDQRIPQKGPEHPLYPTILDALNQFESELKQYGITTHVQGSVYGQAGQIEIWSPDERVFRLMLALEGEEVHLTADYTRDIIPFKVISLDMPITADALAEALARTYIEFLQSDHKTFYERLAQKSHDRAGRRS